MQHMETEHIMQNTHKTQNIELNKKLKEN